MPSQLRCKISNKSVMHKSPLHLHLLEYITTSSVVRDPTRGICQMFSASVVYHYNPTSNRNGAIRVGCAGGVVYHYNPTSNRNTEDVWERFCRLYIIIILHQTATLVLPYLSVRMLYIIIILHQTATWAQMYCIDGGLYIIIILHQTAT